MKLRRLLLALVLSVCVLSWPTPPGAAGTDPPTASDTAIDELLAAAGGDTVGVLLDQLAAVRLDWRLERIEWRVRAETDSLRLAWQSVALERDRPRWWQEIGRDPRLWCLVGILAGAAAAGGK